jgi:hypothetical protein
MQTFFPVFEPRQSLLYDKPGLEIFLGFLQKSANPVSGKGRTVVFNQDSLESRRSASFVPEFQSIKDKIVIINVIAVPKPKKRLVLT